MPLIWRSALSRSKPANASGWRLLVAMVALVAFSFQSFVTQTHIHVQATPVISGMLHTTDANGLKAVALKQTPAPKDKAPANDDPLKCPLCQAVGYAGHFVTPSAATLILSTTPVSILPLASAILSPRETPSHIWQGRAPPRS